MASAEDVTRLLGVFAHPDDDVYTLGGWLARERDAFDVTLVLCTSGDAGPIWIDGVAREDLGDVREREQAASMRALGIDADVRFLRHPDFHLPEVPLEQLVEELAATIRDVAPGIVVTFGPDGLTGHHDHVRAGAAADAAFDRVFGDRQDARLLHVALPAWAVARFDEQLRASGDPEREERSLLALLGVPDDAITFGVDIRTVRDVKLAAIEAHRTQIGELERIPEDLRWIVFDVEWFVQVRPKAPGSPPGTSVVASTP